MWPTVDECLAAIPRKLLTEVASDRDDPVILVASATAGQTEVATPFRGGPAKGWRVFVNASPVGNVTVSQGSGSNGTDVLTMPSPLSAGDRVSATAAGAVNVTNLTKLVLRGQADIRAVFTAARWATPSDDADDVHNTLKEWALDCAAFFALTGSSVASLIQADGSGPYSNVYLRYRVLVLGAPGQKSIFDLIRAGGYNLADITTKIESPTTDQQSGARWGSRERVFSNGNASL